MGRLQNNPSIGLMHPKSTHAHPLAWGNKKGYFITIFRFFDCQISMKKVEFFLAIFGF
jgi:hypothetical protein